MAVSVGDGGQVVLWDLARGEKIREWQLDRSLIHCLALSPGCRFLATGGGDGRVTVYDLDLHAPSDEVSDASTA